MTIQDLINMAQRAIDYALEEAEQAGKNDKVRLYNTELYLGEWTAYMNVLRDISCSDAGKLLEANMEKINKAVAVVAASYAE